MRKKEQKNIKNVNNHPTPPTKNPSSSPPPSITFKLVDEKDWKEYDRVKIKKANKPNTFLWKNETAGKDSGSFSKLETDKENIPELIKTLTNELPRKLAWKKSLGQLRKTIKI